MPVHLDLMSGTMLYNRTFLTLTKSIDAYISLSVHEAYLSHKLTEVLTSSTPSIERTTPDSIIYRALYKKLNESFYKEYEQEIMAALEAEKDPSIESRDTSLWYTSTTLNSENAAAGGEFALSIKDILRRELLLNDKVIAKLTYWSIALMVLYYITLNCIVYVLCGFYCGTYL